MSFSSRQAMTKDHSSISDYENESTLNETMHTNWQFDEARKIWLLKFLNVNPHSPTTHSLKTSDVTFAYDLGYRQALLGMRLELEKILADIQFPEASEINSNEPETSIKSIVTEEIKKLIKSTSGKIETSYHYGSIPSVEHTKMSFP
jgi:hypothetical protein